MLTKVKNRWALNSCAAGIFGVSGWQQGNITYIDIDLNTFILGAVILITTSALIAGYHLIKDKYEKYLESETSNQL